MGGSAHKAQPEASDFAPTRALGGTNSVGSRVQDSPNVLQKSMAGRCERDRSLRANEKLDPDLTLEPTNFLAEVWLRDTQPCRRARKVKLLGDRDKEFQPSVFHRRLI
jgi:hypothetical protein